MKELDPKSHLLLVYRCHLSPSNKHLQKLFLMIYCLNMVSKSKKADFLP